MGAQGNSDELKTGRKLVSRRAVNIGAAWSVPVILTAVAAPTASASPGAVGPPQPTGGSLVHTNGQGFELTLLFPGGATGTVMVVRVYTSQTDFKPDKGSASATIAGGTATFQLTRLLNNSDKTAIVMYQPNGGPTQTFSVPVTM